MEEALTDERFGRFMERMVFFTPDKTRFMGKVRTPYVSTLYHHLAVAPKAEMGTSTLGIFYMHGLIRPGVCYRVLNVRNHGFRKPPGTVLNRTRLGQKSFSPLNLGQSRF